MKSTRLRVLAYSLAFMGAAPFPLSVSAQEKSVPELISVTSTDKVGEQRIVFDFSGAKPTVKSFSLSNPRRMIVDFASAQNKTNKGAIELQGVASQSVELLGDEKRLRAVVALHEDSNLTESWEGNKYVLSVLRKNATPSTSSAPASPLIQKATGADLANQMHRMDFSKGKSAGSGKLVVDLSSAGIPIDIKTQKGAVQIDFMGTSLPVHLAKQFQLSELMTPASSMEWKQMEDRTRVVIKTQGKWEQSAYQLENRFVFEMRPTTDKPSTAEAPNAKYKGDKLTLNFQQIEVRTILQVLADFTGLNIITSDTVGGNITLRLKDVPWDQAMDLILQAKNLDQRRQANVIWIAPQAEIRAKEKADADFKVEQDQNVSMITESVTMNFATAAQVTALLTNAQQRILSKRGSAVADTTTNIVFIQDIPDKVKEAKALIKKVDVPVRQVMIDARIIEASDDFSRSIGARLGFNDTTAAHGNAAVGTNMNTVYSRTGQFATTAALADSYIVNMPSTGAGGYNPTSVAFSIFNSSKTKFLNMELSAMVSDGKGQVLSNPKVVTKNNQAASIQQGTQVPYQQSTSSGATSISFANAMLGMNVTPQITSDGHVSMNISVNKNTLGVLTSAGYAIDTKTIQTNVIVEDGGTVVVGGIYTLSESETEARTPLLGELPYIGWLFKNRSSSKSRKEMLVFITPKVLGSANVEGFDELAEKNTENQIKPSWISSDLANSKGDMPKIKFGYEK